MQAWSATSKDEIIECLQRLIVLATIKGNISNSYLVMNESAGVNYPQYTTRGWFAWANGLFGELIIKLTEYHESDYRYKALAEIVKQGF
ncbi:unnamed protein product [marine sediment metagenome]|uniref:Glycosyl hydrolase family 63 C-terminal domain-containing protein n=1 Tax=marine sediment metagenome TaxID=412755 RepID=X1LZ03_9ZZZZ